MAAEHHKVSGNDAFRRRDYHAAVQHYTAALEALDTTAPCTTPIAGTPQQPPPYETLRVALLANRSLAHLRMGGYEEAGQDAQAALRLQPRHDKAAFRAATALLHLGDAAAALGVIHDLPMPDGAPRGELSASWAAFKVHATARLAHEQRKQQQTGAQQGSQHVAAVQEVVSELEAEADGEASADVDPAALLHHLANLLSQEGQEATARAAAALEAFGSHCHLLLLFHLASPNASCATAATAAFKAAAEAASAGTAAVLWPAQVWQRLVSMASHGDCGSSDSGGSAAMQLLGWAAARDAWVRQQLLLHPLPGSAGRGSPLEQILVLLADSDQLHQLSPAAVVAAAQLLRQYGSDASSVEALLPFRPLLPLVRAAAAIEGMPAFKTEGGPKETTKDASSSGESIAPSSGGGQPGKGSTSSGSIAKVTMEEAERQALEQLRKKRQEVFNEELVAVRRSLLVAAADLALASRELLVAEAVAEKEGSSSKNGKRQVVAGAFLIELLAFVRKLHGQQPGRTAPVLGLDGNPKTYAKRRFAADFKDNPAGDYLLSLYLEDGAGSVIPPGSSTQQQGQGAGGTLLELALGLVLHTATASSTAAALLHRRDLFALCDELTSYCTPSVVTAAQKLYAAVADRVPAAAEKLLQGTAVPALAGLALHSTKEEHQLKALERLAAVADTCSGDDFALLTAAGAASVRARGSMVYWAWQLANSDGNQHSVAAASKGLRQAAVRLLLLCCERAQRQQQLPKSTPPQGGAWSAVGQQALRKLLQCQQEQEQEQEQEDPAAQRAKQDADSSFVDLKKGFLATPGRSAAAKRNPGQQKPQATASPPASSRPANMKGSKGAGSVSTATPGTTHSYKSGAVLIEELPQEVPAGAAAHTDGAPVQASPLLVQQPHALTCSSVPSVQALAAHERADEEEGEEEVPDLQDVYDSSKLAVEMRKKRAQWMALPLAERVRWIQTSVGVDVHIKLPAGTGAAEVQVAATANHLTVGLKWYGRVVDGPLFGPVKAKEVHWCLEDEEVHVLLAKTKESWWKALFEGGQERSYRELLHEAVNADEAVKPYDQLDESAKGLIAAIKERQAYMQAGLIDPEGFDDFRVVLGENSLGAVRSGKGGATPL